MKLLYLSSILPKRSETFVYKEILGLQDLGVSVGVASLYPPEPNLGEPRLDALAASAFPIYGNGLPALLKDALSFSLRNPLRATSTLLLATWDALIANDLHGKARPKVVFQALAAMALAHRVKTENFSHLHIHMAHAAASVGMYAARCLAIPFSLTGHAADLFRERCLLRQKLHRAKFVACISEWHRQWYQSICKRPDDRYPIVRCGVAVPDEPIVPRRIPPLRILGLGRMVPKKGFDILIAACRLLVKNGIHIECTIAGDGPELEKLEHLADGLPIFFPGAVANREVPSMMEKTDVFVLPCRISEDGDRDGIPVVLMEAMATGVCAVSGDLPTIRELITSEKTGMLVPPGDITALADCLESLANDPKFRASLCAAGRSRIQEEFSSEKNLARILAAFHSFP